MQYLGSALVIVRACVPIKCAHHHLCSFIDMHLLCVQLWQELRRVLRPNLMPRTAMVLTQGGTTVPMSTTFEDMRDKRVAQVRKSACSVSVHLLCHPVLVAHQVHNNRSIVE